MSRSSFTPVNRSTQTQAFWAFLSQIITSVTNFVSSVLLVRSMGLEEFGRYTIAFLAIMIVRNFLNSMVLAPISALSPNLRKSSEAAFRLFAITYTGAFSIISSLFVGTVAYQISKFNEFQWTSEIAITLAITILFTNTSDFFRRYFIVNQSAPTAFFIDLTRNLSQIIITIIFIFIASSHLNAGNALLFITVSSMLGTTLGAIKYGTTQYRGRFSRIMWARYWRFSRWMLPATALEAIQGSGPLFIFGAIMGDTALGTVRAIQQVANLLNLPVNTLTQILPSLAARRLISKGEKSVKSFLFKTTIALTTLTAISTAFLMLISDQIFTKWMNIKSEYGPSLLLAFGILTISTILKQIFNTYLYVRERPNHVMLANLIGMLSTLLLTIILISLAGIFTVPLASTCGALTSILTIILISYKTKSNTPPSTAGGNK